MIVWKGFFDPGTHRNTEMRVRSALLVSLVVALLLSAGPGTAAAFDYHEDERRQDIHIELQDDGDAIWSIEHHYVLTNESERERFETFAEEVESGQRDVGTDRATFAQFVPYAEERTDRSMSIENAGWDGFEIRPAAEVEGFDDRSEDDSDVYIGTITYTFTWTNFAETDDGYLQLQDTFLTESGDPWFNGLEPSQRLIIEAPEEHDFVTAPQGIENNRLVWDGPTEFGPEDFDIVLVSRAGVLGTLLGAWPLVLGGLLLAAIAGGVLWYARRQRDDEGGIEPPEWLPSDSVLPDGLTASTAEPAPDRETADREVEPPTPAPNGNGAAATEPEEAEVDPELLSDEERVRRLLSQNGGRMKQAAIVNETGWSNAKVSQLLSQMDDEDEIKKLRIGRENLITLPDVDPTQVE